jgi:hypothetical protein
MSDPNSRSEPGLLPSKTSSRSFHHELTHSLEPHFPTSPYRYDTVSVLLLYWGDDDIGSLREVNVVYKLFTEQFGYYGKKFAIPSSDALWSLRAAVSEFVRGRSEGRSLIIFSMLAMAMEVQGARWRYGVRIYRLYPLRRAWSRSKARSKIRSKMRSALQGGGGGGDESKDLYSGIEYKRRLKF